MLKLYAYAGLCIAVLAGVWYVRSLQTSRDAYEARALSAEASIVTLRTAYEHERKIAKEVSDEYETRLNRLESEKVDTPTRSVRLCRSPTGYVPAPAPAASGAGPTSTGELPKEAGQDPGISPDIGPDLYSLADKADLAGAQCNSLIQWVKAR